MKFIVFIHENSSQKGLVLKRVIVQNFNQIDLQIFWTFNAFKERLKTIPHYLAEEIFILLADTRDRLNQLNSLMDLLENKRIIFILPDESEETLSTAVKFFPRFFTPLSDTYTDLCQVLSKMIDQEKKNTHKSHKGEIQDVSISRNNGSCN